MATTIIFDKRLLHNSIILLLFTKHKTAYIVSSDCKHKKGKVLQFHFE